jgi:hypothetical protein
VLERERALEVLDGWGMQVSHKRGGQRIVGS